MENNIFKYATKELTQDAFICWLLNWINIDNDIENIKEVSKEILKSILEQSKRNGKKINIDDINFDNITIEQQYPVKVKSYKYIECDKTEKEAIRKIDILVSVDDKVAIIIEDKVNTYQHNMQIVQYKKALEENQDKMLSKKNENEDGIITCYYKTFDECNPEKEYIDCILTREEILSILNKHSNIKNMIFNQYKNYLNQIEFVSKNYSNIDKGDDYYLKEKNKRDIKYFGLLKDIENQLINSNITTKGNIWWGKSVKGVEDTWWCNFYIDLNIKDSIELFENKAFIKINFLNNNSEMSLRLSKKKTIIKNISEVKHFEIPETYYDYKDGEYICYAYNGLRYNNKNINEQLKDKKGFKKIIEYCSSNNLELKESGMTKKKSQGEMSIFTIKNIPNISNENVLNETMSLIKVIAYNLKGEEIKL